LVSCLVWETPERGRSGAALRAVGLRGPAAPPGSVDPVALGVERVVDIGDQQLGEGVLVELVLHAADQLLPLGDIGLEPRKQRLGILDAIGVAGHAGHVADAVLDPFGHRGLNALARLHQRVPMLGHGLVHRGLLLVFVGVLETGLRARREFEHLATLLGRGALPEVLVEQEERRVVAAGPFHQGAVLRHLGKAVVHRQVGREDAGAVDLAGLKRLVDLGRGDVHRDAAEVLNQLADQPQRAHLEALHLFELCDRLVGVADDRVSRGRKPADRHHAMLEELLVLGGVMHDEIGPGRADGDGIGLYEAEPRQRVGDRHLGGRVARGVEAKLHHAVANAREMRFRRHQRTGRKHLERDVAIGRFGDLVVEPAHHDHRGLVVRQPGRGAVHFRRCPGRKPEPDHAGTEQSLEFVHWSSSLENRLSEWRGARGPGRRCGSLLVSCGVLPCRMRSRRGPSSDPRRCCLRRCGGHAPVSRRPYRRAGSAVRGSLSHGAPGLHCRRLWRP